MSASLCEYARHKHEQLRHTYANIRQLYVYLRQYSINYEHVQTKNGKIRKYNTICGEITVNSWLCMIHFGQ